SYWLRRNGPPQLSVDTNHALSPRRQTCKGNARFANQLFFSGGQFPGSRTQDHLHQEYGDHRKRNRDGERQAQADAARREWRANQKQSAEEHRDGSANPQYTVTRELRLQNEHGNRQQDQEHSREVYW